ncbi:putative E3 ubiquitin-protein ligase MARCH [Helianthus debilis subsp. tardiflorus]
MGDHFVFLVDRLLTESTLEAAIESRKPVDETVIECCSKVMGHEGVYGSEKLFECRICQDEDFDSNMETPCSCSGSLKYAHRRCVQRWCNEKGDIKCEICHQQFRPGYTAPPPVFKLGDIPASFRGHWQISRRDMNNNGRIITVVPSDPNFLDQEYDEYAESTARSILCFRSVAFIFMILLILRHTLPVLANGAGNYSLPVFLLLLIRASGIIVPIYIILRAFTALLHRRHHLASNSSTSSLSSSDEEAGPTPL